MSNIIINIVNNKFTLSQYIPMRSEIFWRTWDDDSRGTVEKGGKEGDSHCEGWYWQQDKVSGISTMSPCVSAPV